MEGGPVTAHEERDRSREVHEDPLLHEAASVRRWARTESPRTRLRRAAGTALDAVGKREVVRSSLARGLTRLGIGSGLTTGDGDDDVRRFLKVSAACPPPLPLGAARPRVAFVAPYGLIPRMLRLTGLLGLALRVRGAEVCVVTCDQCLPACETTCVLDYADGAAFLETERPAPCEACYSGAATAVGAFSLPSLRLGAYSSTDLRNRAQLEAQRFVDRPLDDLYDYRLDDVDLGKIVKTSLFRFFLKGTLADKDPVRGVALRYLRTGIEVTGMVERLISAWRPDVLLSHHGVYLIGGTSLAVAEVNGVRGVAWDGGYRHSSVLLSHSDTYHREMRSETSRSWDRPLEPREAEALAVYLIARRKGAMDVVTYHPSPLVGRDEVMAAAGLRDGERLVSLFTNVVWDAQVWAPETLFRGPVEWVLDTLRHVADAKGVRYVIRIHPAEVKNTAVPTQERMDDQIRAAFPELPDNVVVIPPEHDLSSYSLAAASDLSVVYSSQIGLEILAMGKPTVIAGDASYSRKEIGIEPPDRATYYDLLRHPERVPPMSGTELERVRRYAYHYFFRRTIIMPDIVDVTRSGLPRVRSVRDLLPGRYAGLDAVCNGILAGTPFEVDDAAAVEAVLSGAVD